VDSVLKAEENLQAIGAEQSIEEVVADKGYHAAHTLELCNSLDLRTYIPEPQRKSDGNWTERTPEHQRAVHGNRQRVRRAKGKQLQRRRSELCERSFAHVCETGGMRRTWLRGLMDVTKRYLIDGRIAPLGPHRGRVGQESSYLSNCNDPCPANSSCANDGHRRRAGFVNDRDGAVVVIDLDREVRCSISRASASLTSIQEATYRCRTVSWNPWPVAARKMAMTNDGGPETHYGQEHRPRASKPASGRLCNAAGRQPIATVRIVRFESRHCPFCPFSAENREVLRTAMDSVAMNSDRK